MNALKTFSPPLLWIARISGSISLLFLVFMVGAHLVEWVAGQSKGSGLSTAPMIISFVGFPISTMVGLALAYKWEKTGGLIVLIGISVFHVVLSEPLFDSMIDLLAAPGLLYLIYGLAYKR